MTKQLEMVIKEIDGNRDPMTLAQTLYKCCLFVDSQELLEK